MITWLKDIDQKLFLFFNGMHNAFFDEVMYWFSHKFFWIPLYVLLLYFIIKTFKKESWKPILAIIVVAVLTDQLSVHVFKNVFQRYRPCHNLEIQNLVHLLNNHCGGIYGFVSSHAANTFGLAFFIGLLFRSKKWMFGLLFWAAVVSYSRIYAGVHYPADVAVGAILGMGVAALVFFVSKKIPFLNSKTSLQE